MSLTTGAAAYPVLKDPAGPACSERSLNTFEELSKDPWPPCGTNCDVFSQVQRGVLTKDFNLGLTFPQSKRFSVDSFNQGCLNPWGCVEAGGFSCLGAPSSFGPFMSSRFNHLMSPLDPSLQEFHPPSYMLGMKKGTPNTAASWAAE